MKERTLIIFEDLFLNYPKLEVCKPDILKITEIIGETYKNGGKLLVCGNGGSASDSQHIVGELMKGFMLKRSLSKEENEKINSVGGENIGEKLQGSLPAVSLVGENALFTAFCNDCDSSMVFAQQVYGLMNKNDTLLCLSTSGNSANVVNASYVGKSKGGKVVSVVGEKGGKLAEISDVAVKLPSNVTPAIQELTLPTYHCICAMLESEFFED
ncbi:MAG: SIS domain-containing protein [Acutalibacteraceae bacterium]